MIAQTAVTTHACPIGDALATPCCGRTPFELPTDDRMTLDPALVTCWAAFISLEDGRYIVRVGGVRRGAFNTRAGARRWAKELRKLHDKATDQHSEDRGTA